jgi:2-iminobutanoate/2-iminopropanoate deaminase
VETNGNLFKWFTKLLLDKLIIDIQSFFIQNIKTMTRSIIAILLTAILFLSCNTADNNKATPVEPANRASATDAPEYFNLRPKLEKDYGYSHAVKIGDDLKISGAVSMNDAGIIVAPENMEQQMKNCYSDLEKILQHYGYTFDDVFAENIYTTNMIDFIKVSGFRNSVYKKQFPTGTWLEVKGLAIAGQLIEIDMEAHKTK